MSAGEAVARAASEPCAPVDWLTVGAAAALALGASWAGTAAMIRLLRAKGILDRPNPRSSHRAPVPRGGGLAPVAVAIAAWAGALVWTPGASLWPVLVGASLLACVSLLDDLRGLSPLVRIVVHGLAVALGSLTFAATGGVFQGLVPPVFDLILAGLIWVWFLNLFNFMDGIDGIAGAEAACVGAGFALVVLGLGAELASAYHGLTLAAAAAGFLFWNWQPAKVFMGDVGSVPLGYLIGWLLLWLASQGAWEQALVLPLYFLADGTVTLARRLARGERVWRAHREHFYQRAVEGGRSHAGVVRAVLAANLGLVALAAAAPHAPQGLALGLGTLVVLFLLAWLGRRRAVA